jgi:septal ring factor EnvC (AmiA/AmiB activator)
MSDDPRIIELLSEMLIEQRLTNQRLDSVDQHLVSVDQRLGSVEREITELKHQQEITNIKQDVVIDELSRLRKAIVQLAEGSSVSFEKLDDHEHRIQALEGRA